MIKTGDCSDR
ncbi:hypothetical protein CGLO_14762 [Colletotrichum gloeosporioides Cg-14]|uniref:Uncharacterized protein n=1 Tax=Colletotrichum gloeosporioides (strain Cg-14) TaxID=1237896 RepID=T0K091_COLGC|nr:hypothetical protein CGLO_14762 [Colletotrichum gloeosporioides Cg-14]